jgi:mRNA interferase MazF
MTICERFDVVVVPFPFSDSAGAKPRPALVLSGARFNAANGASVLAMITRGLRLRWPSDVPVSDGAAAGLAQDSVVRLKLFTLENVLIARRIGALAPKDRRSVTAALARCLGRRLGRAE